MAKKRLTIKDKQGNFVNYDISSASVTIDVEGKTLDVKLTELAAAIQAAVNTVVYNGTPHYVNNSIVDLGNQIQPDWAESATNYPSYIRNKPDVVTGIKVGEGGETITPTGGIITLPNSGGGQVTDADTEMSDTSENAVQNKVIKAYVDAVSQRIDTLIGSGNVQGAIDTFNEVVAFLNGINSSDTLAAKLLLKQDTLVAGNGITIAQDGKTVSVAEAIRTGAAAGATAVQSVSVNGESPVTPDGNGNVDLTGLQMPVISISETTGNWTIDGQDTGVHAQGETGNITATDGVVTFGLVNNLSSLDTDKGLTAKMGHDLLLIIAQIYDSLGASAFWGNKPAIDWSRIGLTYKSITRTLDANCSSSKSDSRVLYGSSYQEVISTASGYVLNSITLTMVGDANAQSYVDLATGVINIPEVTGDITIVAAAVAGFTITKNLTGASSSNTAVGVVPNAAFESKIDADNYWQMVDHDFVCMMGDTELPIVLEDGYPANAVPSSSNYVDIENEDCVVWKCDYDSVNKKYSKPYYQVSIKAVTGDITITGKAVNVLQNNSLGGREDQSANYAEGGSVANRTGWVHNKRFPMPANINGARDNDTLDWKFSSGSSEVSGNHSGCTIRMSTHLYSLTNDETISGGDHFDVVVYYGVRGANDVSSGKRNVARKYSSTVYRLVTASYHFTSDGSLSGKGIKEGADSIIDAADFLPPTE